MCKSCLLNGDKVQSELVQIRLAAATATCTGMCFFLFRFGENVLFMADYLGKLSEMTLNVVMVDGMR